MLFRSASTLGESGAVYIIVILVYFTINFILGFAAQGLERVVNRRAGRGGTGAAQKGSVPLWAFGGRR